MGMFDYVRVPRRVNCPKCGKRVTGWQSKDAGCMLTDVSLRDVTNFYTGCDNCGTWIEFNLKRPRKVTLDDFEMS